MAQLIYQERDARVMQAYKVFQNDDYTNVTKCVLEYACNRQNLQNRLIGTLSKSNRFSICKRYTKIQKQIIVDYIICLDNINILLTIELVVDTVNCLFLFGAFSVDNYWFRCFYNRYSELRICRQMSIVVARKNISSNIKILKLYFKKLKIVVDKKNIQETDY